VRVAAGDQARAAGGEGPFTGQGRRQGLGRERLPTGPAVVGGDHLEPAVDGGAEGGAVVLVPEGDGVEGASGGGALELHSPGLAAVGRFVHAGGVAGAGAEQVGGIRPERLDVAEVELLRTGYGPDRPGFAAVDGARVRARRSADPGDVRAHDAESAEVGLG